jgi:hypothetical protein
MPDDSKLASAAGAALKKVQPLIAKQWESGDFTRKPKEVLADLNRAPYEYAALPKGRSIRLLRLERGTGGEVIRGSLRIVNLDDKPEYTALSYPWK